jgi:hypothetical protein
MQKYKMASGKRKFLLKKNRQCLPLIAKFSTPLGCTFYIQTTGSKLIKKKKKIDKCTKVIDRTPLSK